MTTHLNEFFAFVDPNAVAILRRIRAMGYEVRADRRPQSSARESHLEIRAADYRTGERHVTTASGVGPDAEHACARAMAELVADELEG
jgi:hypothetical protein